ncbi:GNAT family N-acetyltransferase [Paenibacillus campi]|uniref:GNAT family N-acetyltransferase n=1 Tax=Paenibacillus campi TaxID=3106031 RepID=UPI002AFDCB68|nr:GNAT family N-acetyltransferase [Paenibacillus sp. SGZ-1014]
MRNPIKELMGIKDSINDVKGTMDEIKSMLDDVKGDVDEAQQKLQGTMEHAKSTSEKAKSSTDQFKQALSEAGTSIGASKQHMQSSKQDIQQTATVIKSLFGKANDDSRPNSLAEQSSQDAALSSTDSSVNASSWLHDVEGAKLFKEGPAYFVKLGERIIGEITYVPGPENDTWTLNHTYVDPQFRGGRIAKGLLDEVAQAARTADKKIFPTCSYALAQFKRDQSYADVWLRS